MKQKILTLMNRISFPADSIRAVSEAFDKIEGSPAERDRFHALIKEYDATEHCDYLRMLEDMKEISREASIDTRLGDLLLLLSLCDTLKKRYDAKGLSEEIYYNTVSDLKYKNEECLLLFGTPGTFVSPWFPGFFKLERFALGRLQFEIIKLQRDAECNGIKLEAGREVINIHIPRTGTRLDHGEVEKAYDLAKAFYSDVFKDKPTVFACHSWLLYPWHESILDKSSNLYAFYKDFTIIESGESTKHSDVWRLFDCVFDGDASKLPRNSSLRRAYADRIANGKPTGWGLGVFIRE